jgi:tRNA-dihydrouridine synthase
MKNYIYLYTIKADGNTTANLTLNTKMTISSKIRKVWKKEYEHGDIQKASDATGLCELTVSRALKGRCSKRTFDLLNGYFLEKKKNKKQEVEKVLQQFADHD